MTAPTYRLSVPATPASVRVIRTVASAVAADESLSFDQLDEMNLAIDEASAALLEHVEGDVLDCALDVGDHQLSFLISMPAATNTGWPLPEWRSSLGVTVLNAIASDVDFLMADGNPAVAFAVSV